jgi:DNA/RNA-binding domain of Phe-tRNA-synthetase-like protein
MGAAGMSEPPVQAEPTLGRVAEEIAEEFPALRLHWLTVNARPGRSPQGLKERLRRMSDRFHGAQAIAMRQEPIPHAYRVFYRHIGLDPDADRTPVEEAAVQRLIKGAFRSENVLDDALLIALVETGVPIWALDAHTLSGRLGIRLAEEAERLGTDALAPPLAAGRLVVADEERPLALLFGPVARGHGVTSSTTRMALFSLQVQGVPEIHVEEALWLCLDVLRGGSD